MRSERNTRRVWIYILLAIIVVLLNVCAWHSAARGTFNVFLYIGAGVGAVLLFGILVTSSRLGEVLRGFALSVAAVGVVISLLGAYTLVCPGYRAEVAAQKAVVTQAETAEAQRVTEVMAEVELPDNCVSSICTGKMLVAFAGDDGPVFSALEGLVTEGTAQQFDEAATLVWIQEEAVVVGTYKPRLLGLFKTGDALRVTWKVWLIDVESRTVTGCASFTGAEPPETTEATGDVAGAPPEAEVVAWLNELYAASQFVYVPEVE